MIEIKQQSRCAPCENARASAGALLYAPSAAAAVCLPLLVLGSPRCVPPGLASTTLQDWLGGTSLATAASDPQYRCLGVSRRPHKLDLVHSPGMDGIAVPAEQARPQCAVLSRGGSRDAEVADRGHGHAATGKGAPVTFVALVSHSPPQPWCIGTLVRQ